MQEFESLLARKRDAGGKSDNTVDAQVSSPQFQTPPPATHLFLDPPS